jgi:hypothetical protein
MVPRMNTCGLRLLLAILLAVSIGAGGALADALHGAAMSDRAVAEIVICAADGSTETILVDRDGNAVAPQKPCPVVTCDDCLPPQGAAVPVSTFALAVAGPAGRGASLSPLRPAEKNRIGSNPARAPPTGETAA